MPEEPEGLRTLRSMAALAGRQVSCAHSLTAEVVAAFFITENDSCWHWSSKGLKQLSHLEMLNLRHLQGLAYYQEEIWNQIQRQKGLLHRHKMQNLVQAALNSKLDPVTNALSFLQQGFKGLARR